MDLNALHKMYDFTGRTIVVTGATGVLCGAMAKALVGCGANVAINYLREPEEARETEEQVHACVHKVRQEGVQDVLVGGQGSLATSTSGKPLPPRFRQAVTVRSEAVVVPAM